MKKRRIHSTGRQNLPTGIAEKTNRAAQHAFRIGGLLNCIRIQNQADLKTQKSTEAIHLVTKITKLIERETGVLEEGANESGFAAKALHGAMQTESQLPQVEADCVTQLDVLEVLPHSLVWIEIRRIGREPLDEDLLGGKLRKEERPCLL